MSRKYSIRAIHARPPSPTSRATASVPTPRRYCCGASLSPSTAARSLPSTTSMRCARACCGRSPRSISASRSRCSRPTRAWWPSWLTTISTPPSSTTAPKWLSPTTAVPDASSTAPPTGPTRRSSASLRSWHGRLTTAPSATCASTRARCRCTPCPCMPARACRRSSTSIIPA